MVGGIAGLVFFTVMGMMYLTAQGNASDEEVADAFWPHALVIAPIIALALFVLCGMA